MADLDEKVKKIISQQLSVSGTDVKWESHFANDLGADSLDAVELVMALEDEFGIQIPDHDAVHITTVKHAVEYIRTKRQ